MEFDTHFQIKKNKTENDFLGNFKVIFWGTKCLKNHPKCLIFEFLHQIRGVFKSSCANAQAHSGQEFPTLTTGGRSIDLIFWEPKSFGCRQQITGGAAFALSDKFLKIKFLQL